MFLNSPSCCHPERAAEGSAVAFGRSFASFPDREGTSEHPASVRCPPKSTTKQHHKKNTTKQKPQTKTTNRTTNRTAKNHNKTTNRTTTKTTANSKNKGKPGQVHPTARSLYLSPSHRPDQSPSQNSEVPLPSHFGKARPTQHPTPGFTPQQEAGPMPSPTPQPLAARFTPQQEASTSHHPTVQINHLPKTPKYPSHPISEKARPAA